jgi:hypothetical protein
VTLVIILLTTELIAIKAGDDFTTVEYIGLRRNALAKKQTLRSLSQLVRPSRYPRSMQALGVDSWDSQSIELATIETDEDLAKPQISQTQMSAGGVL